MGCFRGENPQQWLGGSFVLGLALWHREGSVTRVFSLLKGDSGQFCFSVPVNTKLLLRYVQYRGAYPNKLIFLAGIS